MSLIFILTNFKSDCWGHGGEKRTAQIQSLFEGREKVSFHLNTPNSSILTKLKYSIFPSKELRSLYKKANIQLPFIKKLKENQRISREIKVLKSTESFIRANLIIWESTNINHWYIPYLCKNLNKKIWAFPHNLESLVPNQDNLLDLNEWLNIEISYLKQCNRIYTISQEENWLIETLGGLSETFPYYPSIEVEKFLLSCRDTRNQITDGKYMFFIIGTMGNSPTQLGLQELLNYIQSQEWPSNISFKIAGFGTEILKNQHLSQNVEISGTIDINQLKTYMQECSAIIINQKTSSGALTKIIEFLIAGVPIICNIGSARSYYKQEGIHIFSDVKDLKEIILNHFTFEKITVKIPINNSFINILDDLN